MKSEDVILQELERERQERLAAEEGPAAAAAASAANEKSTKFMISGEAPVLMSKACELMIKDLSFRAWRHTERNRRRTLQKQDLHAAVGESEVYDFLIDIVPRVTTTATTTQKVQHSQPSHLPASATVMAPPSVGMQQVVGGMSVGLPTAVSQPQHPTTTQAGVGVIDNTGMMQMMGTPQQQAQQQQQTNQFHQDPSQQQQQQQQQAPGMQSQPGPQNLHQQQQHLQQTFATMPPIEGAQLGISLPTGQPVGGAPGTMQTVGGGSTLDTNFTTTTIPPPASQSEATSSLQVPHNWPAVNQPES
ncbi:MAG: histone H3/H4 [Bacillariaceae sp.]|jgi:nuclear transcription factor Y gamma